MSGFKDALVVSRTTPFTGVVLLLSTLVLSSLIALRWDCAGNALACFFEFELFSRFMRWLFGCNALAMPALSTGISSHRFRALLDCFFEYSSSSISCLKRKEI